jgi:uncharacterized membrane protein HdeD (DUF308 family)
MKLAAPQVGGVGHVRFAMPSFPPEETMPESDLSKNWWVVLLRGVLAIAFGVLTFAQSGLTLAALVAIVGAFALIEGVMASVSSIRVRRIDRDWWVLLMEGLFGVAIGLITFLNPAVTVLALLFYIATWAMTLGALRIVSAVRLRRVIHGELWLILSGVISIGFGILMLLFPGAGALALVTYIGAWAMVSGAALVLLSFRLRSLHRGMMTTSGSSGGPVQAGAH